MDCPQILLSGPREGWENYRKALEQAGATYTGGYCPGVDTGCDGLLLCGGGDIEPRRFGQEDAGSTDLDPDRDRAEFALAEAFLAAGKPILGICRGHQVLNVALGGDLVQDLGPELNPFHRREPGIAQDKVHPVRAEAGSLLHSLCGPLFPVNSSHHQAVGRTGRCLRVTARSESGVVEAMEHEQLPVLCVQFHPERMSYGLRRADTADGAAIFQWFVRRCGGWEG